MSYRRILNVLCALLSAACLVQPALADYRINVDNKANPTTVSTWGTADNIFLEIVYLGLGGSDEVQLPDSLYIQEDRYVQVVGGNLTWDDVDYVRLSTDGQDMFGVDQLRLMTGIGVVQVTHGVDNMNAWCISEDPNDGYTGTATAIPRLSITTSTCSETAPSQRLRGYRLRV